MNYKLNTVSNCLHCIHLHEFSNIHQEAHISNQAKKGTVRQI